MPRNTTAGFTAVIITATIIPVTIDGTIGAIRTITITAAITIGIIITTTENVPKKRRGTFPPLFGNQLPVGRS
ncbi:MAG: hypothetical protein ACYC9S_00035 [Leptospirales bacterium]